MFSWYEWGIRYFILLNWAEGIFTVYKKSYQSVNAEAYAVAHKPPDESPSFYKTPDLSLSI